MNEQKGEPFNYPGLPISTERLIMRAMTRDDLEPLYQLNSDPEVMRYCGRGQTWSREFTEQIIGPIIGNTKDHVLDWVTIADKTAPRTFLGMVCLLRLPEVHRAQVGGGPYIEIGWRILWEHWNHGYATEAATAVANYGFTVRGLNELVCIIDERNTKSLRVAEKLGFQHMRTYEHNTQRIRFHRMDQKGVEARHERLKPRAT